MCIPLLCRNCHRAYRRRCPRRTWRPMVIPPWCSPFRRRTILLRVPSFSYRPLTNSKFFAYAFSAWECDRGWWDISLRLRTRGGRVRFRFREKRLSWWACRRRGVAFCVTESVREMDVESCLLFCLGHGYGFWLGGC